MIFFEKKLDPFYSNCGMRVLPEKCELLNGLKGFVVGIEWKKEIEEKGVIVKEVNKSNIKIEKHEFN